MLSHVLLQIIRHFASVVALLTCKRFLAGVRKHVILQTFGVTGRDAAQLTCKGLFSRMGQNVCLEVPSSCEGTVALCAIESFFS